jgi:putative tryptophan/tyrosine transport system substrate-binding protein
MKRRAFIAGLGSAAAGPVVARAQQRKPIVGVLTSGRTDEEQAAFRQGLADFGYVVGQNITLTWKDAAGDMGRLNQVAAELVAAKADVVFGMSSSTTFALKRQTNSIPIVSISADPVGTGLVASLARPGGNITGLSLLGPDVAGKRIELLKEIIPDAATVAAFWKPDEQGARFSLRETQAASTSLALNLRVFETREVADLDSAFSDAAKEGDQAVILLPAPFMGRNAGRIAELALRNRLPTFAFVKEEAKAGELVSFGPSILAATRRAAYFVDRILKGASPSDLPVEQPTKFDLVINLKTAKALGLTVPSPVLARADEVIE